MASRLTTRQGALQAGSVILAAGGVLERPGPHGPEIALVYRERYDGEWSLPKGKLDRGESFEQAAVREVLEETACRASIRGFIGAIDYRVRNGRPKVVLYYDLDLEREGEFKPGREIQDLAWLLPRRALERLRHPGEREILKRFLKARR